MSSNFFENSNWSQPAELSTKAFLRLITYFPGTSFKVKGIVEMGQIAFNLLTIDLIVLAGTLRFNQTNELQRKGCH